MVLESNLSGNDVKALKEFSKEFKDESIDVLQNSDRETSGNVDKLFNI